MGSVKFKVVDLFGVERDVVAESAKRTQTDMHDYEGFVEKFTPKKTTDDCYTPPEAYKIVLDYVRERCDIGCATIVRPFYPGGDFESVPYSSDMVVVDNPPFSIITKICRFYINNGVRFFLFGPHLTAFSSDIDVTHIIASADITYANGATIKTSFVSNMFGDLKIIGAADLCRKFKDLEASKKVNLPKYEYPDNILTVSKVSYFVEKGFSIEVKKQDVAHCRALDSQKPHGKTLFGSGFLTSAATAAATAAAKSTENIITWQLSPREMQIIERLGLPPAGSP